MALVQQHLSEESGEESRHSGQQGDAAPVAGGAEPEGASVGSLLGLATSVSRLITDMEGAPTVGVWGDLGGGRGMVSELTGLIADMEGKRYLLMPSLTPFPRLRSWIDGCWHGCASCCAISGSCMPPGGPLRAQQRRRPSLAILSRCMCSSKCCHRRPWRSSKNSFPSQAPPNGPCSVRGGSASAGRGRPAALAARVKVTAARQPLPLPITLACSIGLMTRAFSTGWMGRVSTPNDDQHPEDVRPGKFLWALGAARVRMAAAAGEGSAAAASLGPLPASPAALARLAELETEARQALARVGGVVD